MDANAESARAIVLKAHPGAYANEYSDGWTIEYKNDNERAVTLDEGPTESEAWINSQYVLTVKEWEINTAKGPSLRTDDLKAALGAAITHFYGLAFREGGERPSDIVKVWIKVLDALNEGRPVELTD